MPFVLCSSCAVPLAEPAQAVHLELPSDMVPHCHSKDHRVFGHVEEEERTSREKAVEEDAAELTEAASMVDEVGLPVDDEVYAGMVNGAFSGRRLDGEGEEEVGESIAFGP